MDSRHQLGTISIGVQSASDIDSYMQSVLQSLQQRLQRVTDKMNAR